MNNDIVDPTADDLDNERKAVAALLAAAAQGLAETPAPEPAGSAQDFYDLVEQQKQLAAEVQTLKNKEIDLMRQLDSVRDQVVQIE
jgi:hypothetical protein